MGIAGIHQLCLQNLSTAEGKASLKPGITEENPPGSDASAPHTKPDQLGS